MKGDVMTFEKSLQEHVACFSRLGNFSTAIEGVAAELSAVIRTGRKILICGNGGSAADAQHFAAELIGRFEKERSSFPAVALTTDSSILTALGNDYGFEAVFARQVQGLGRRGDALIGISTSGNSENVIRAVESARSAGLLTIGLLGRDGGRLQALVDRPVTIAESKTARIQEAHIFILHYWALVIEQDASA
jgi:D-sedoheptulose 7-phosphate isomerase